MRKSIIATAGAAILLGGFSIAGAHPAVASTTWDFSTGSVTLSDVQGETGTLTIRRLQVSGSSANGTIELSHTSRFTCSTSSFAGMTATFALDGRYNPCSGTVTFAIDSAGLLSVSDSSVYIPSTLFTGPGTGSVQGTGPRVASCSLAFSGTQGTATWTTQGSGFDGFAMSAPGGTISASGSATSLTFGMGSQPSGHKAYVLEGMVGGGGGAPVALCEGDYSQPAPGSPHIASLVPVDNQVSVNYVVSEPTSVVQGVEYQIDGGSWKRVGGLAPTGGVSGSFPISALAPGTYSIALRSLNFDTPVAYGSSSVERFEILAPPKNGPSGSARPGRPSTATVIGSTARAPVAAPPVQPTSTVPGTSNGAGTGTNGALAATTGDPGIDAACLAQDGTLYPPLYSTVGSQLTMAPNTHGLGKVTSFTIVGGALPPGLQLDRTFGVLFGVTTQAGSWATTVRATFADTSTKDEQFTIRVDNDPQNLQYAAQNIGSVGSDIVIAPSTNAPVVGTTYALVCGELPAGTRFDTRTGRILGAPTSVVARPVPLRVAETSRTGRAAASFIFVVNKAGASAISYPAHPHARVAKRVTIRPTVAGVGDVAVFRMWKGKLPRGLHLNNRTGSITGRIAHRGPRHTITIVAVTRGGALLTAAPMRLTITR